MPRICCILLGVLLLSSSSFGQGCSDAGFCTMGSMRPDQAYSKKVDLKLRAMELNLYQGQSIHTPVIYVATIDATIGINEINYLQVKLPYQYAEGELGSARGMGDISLSFTHVLRTTNRYTLSGTLGGKIPMGDGAEEVNNSFTGGVDQPIHMYYQPSLGTYDIVGGLSWINERWLFATGIQIPLNRTENEFLWSKFPNYPNREYIEQYDPAPRLKRGIDVMLRAERNWRFTNYNFSLGLLPIWRITPDNGFISESGVPRVEWQTGDLPGTTGLALSALVSFGYHFDVNNSIKIIHGHKLAQRDVNPDGLTRKWVNSISYIYKF